MHGATSCRFNGRKPEIARDRVSQPPAAYRVGLLPEVGSKGGQGFAMSARPGVDDVGVRFVCRHLGALWGRYIPVSTVILSRDELSHFNFTPRDGTQSRTAAGSDL